LSASASHARARTEIVTPARIIGASFLLAAIGVLAALAWRVTGNIAWVTFYFRYLGASFLVACAAIESRFCLEALAEFGPGDPMRLVWALLTLSGLLRLISMVLVHVVAKDTYLNPWFVLSRSWDSGAAAAVERFGFAVNAPVGFAFLGMALVLVLRLYRRMKLMVRLRWSDFALLALIAAFLVRQAYEFVYYLSRAETPPRLERYATWLTDPMLAAVLALAVAIRRASQSLGRGMIERCWTCYVAGVVLTSVANIGAWAAINVHIPWPYSAVTWYLWFPPAAAFALAPVCQAAAVRQAKRGLAGGAPG
jgi:uncharacterized membrane protein